MEITIKPNNMEKRIKVYLYILLIVLILTGCSNIKEEEISLEIWHYYNGAQKLAFDEFVDEFNETVGLDKGIIIEAYSQGDIDRLEEKVNNVVNQELGSSVVPDMVTIYSDTAFNLNNKGLIANLDNYLNSEELDEYVNSYIEDGRLGDNREFKIFPIAKSTELLMLNRTDWDKFADATGAKIEKLSTWEGIKEIGELYYNWTNGKSFFGRDALANYILVGSKQLGVEMFQVEDDQVKVNLDYKAMKRMWENYYIPYISGYYSSYGKFSSDDAKIGEIIALVGSTTGAIYFPEHVTVDDGNSYPVELCVLPLPNFKNTKSSAVQQGAGIVVFRSNERKEKAAVEFLKWFTEESRNSEFSIKTGYLPVKKSAYKIESFRNEFNSGDTKGLPKQLKSTIPLAMEQIEEYDLYYSKAFESGFKTRSFLESELRKKVKEDREKVIKLIDEGLSHKEAVGKFTTDEKFDEWLKKFEEELLRVVKDEK